MSLFGNVDTQGMVEQEDRLGGGFSTYESDVYPATIKMAYVSASKGGAQFVSFEFDLGEGRTYKEDIYVTNSKGQAYFTKDGKNIPLPGFTHVNNICIMATEKGMVEQDHELKMVQIWDFESSKMIPREMPVLVDLIGQEILLAIQQVRENKQEKSGEKWPDGRDKYAPVNEERIINNIVAVFHSEYFVTVLEAQNEKEPEFMDKWLEKNKGVTYDKYKEVKSSAGGAARTSGTASSASAPARKSMFAKKG